MKKALITTSVASMIKQFNMTNINLLREMGYQVTVATNFKNPGTIPTKDGYKLFNELKSNNIKVFNIPFHRSPANKQNITAYRKIKEIIKVGNFDLIHCQSPVGGAITRLAAINARRLGTKLIYTAHGFHFYNGSPKINWLIYYPIEKKLSKYTDTIITINQEDFERAKTFDANRIELINGVGIDQTHYLNINVNKKLKRREINIPKDAFVVTSVGELNDNKNHKVIIAALATIKNSNIHYVLCGKGELEKELIKLTEKLGLEKNVHFLGFRRDIPEILEISNCFAFPSKREGLGLAAIEAMAMGLPLLTSNIHGINDYSKDEITGFKFPSGDVNGFARGIIKIFNLDKNSLEVISNNNKEIAKKYDQNMVLKQMKRIYNPL